MMMVSIAPTENGPYSESIKSMIEAMPKKTAKIPRISAGTEYTNVYHEANALAILLMMIVNGLLINKGICISTNCTNAKNN